MIRDLRASTLHNTIYTLAFLILRLGRFAVAVVFNRATVTAISWLA